MSRRRLGVGIWFCMLWNERTFVRLGESISYFNQSGKARVRRLGFEPPRPPFLSLAFSLSRTLLQSPRLQLQDTAYSTSGVFQPF